MAFGVRLLVSTVYVMTFCTVALLLPAVVPTAPAPDPVLSPGAWESHRDAISLANMLNIALGFVALLLHLGTLIAGYRRWQALSVSMWGTGSALAGLLGYPVWAAASRLGAWLPMDGSELPVSMVLVAVATVMVTSVIFETMTRGGAGVPHHNA